MESRKEVLDHMSYEEMGLQALVDEHGIDMQTFAACYDSLDVIGKMEKHQAILKLLDRLAYQSSDLPNEVDCYMAETGMDRELP